MKSNVLGYWFIMDREEQEIEPDLTSRSTLGNNE
jgi:hypothetical protein